MGSLLFASASKTIDILSWWYRFQSPATIANFKPKLSREIVDSLAPDSFARQRFSFRH
jgi:hypothetical protein